MFDEAFSVLLRDYKAITPSGLATPYERAGMGCLVLKSASTIGDDEGIITPTSASTVRGLEAVVQAGETLARDGQPRMNSALTSTSSARDFKRPNLQQKGKKAVFKCMLSLSAYLQDMNQHEPVEGTASDGGKYRILPLKMLEYNKLTG